jgi:hypothetical protein
MRLADFKRGTAGEHARYVARVEDITGAADYELVVAGPDKLIEQVFAESDFDVAIDPERGFEDAEAEFRSDAEEDASRFAELAALEKVSELPLFKKAPPEPDEESSVFVSLRRVRGAGTFWGPWTFPFFLFGGWSIWVWPPPLCTLRACVMPASGDQDLFLFRNGIPPALLSASRFGGTATDCVSFSNPPLTSCSVSTWNFLAIRVFGFTTGSGTFTMRGFS